MNRKYILGLIIFCFNLVFNEESIDDYIIFSETDIDYTIDPYKTFNEEWDGKYRRFYALLHETIFEPSSESSSFILNFTDSYEYILDGLPEGFKSQVILTFQKSGVPWLFHDLIDIDVKDIAYSIKYAICSGVIDSELISYDDVIFNQSDNSVIISSRVRIPEDVYKRYLKDSYIIPSDCFSEYIDSGCEVISEMFNDEYYKYPCILKYNNSPVDSMAAAGPFEVEELLNNQKIKLEVFDRYYKKEGKFTNNYGFVITANSLIGKYASEVQSKVTNLAINIPPATFQESKHIAKKKLQTYSSKQLIINYNKNDNLNNKAFRKAISYMIDNEGEVKLGGGRFNGDAVALSGPFSNFSTWYNHNITKSKKMKKDAENFSKWSDEKKEYHFLDTNQEFDPMNKNHRQLLTVELLKEAGYSVLGNLINGYQMKNSDGSDLEVLTLIYYNQISKDEKDFIERIVPESLDKIGIKVKPRLVNSKSSFENMKKFSKNKWDLCYDEFVIKNLESVKKHYHSDPRIGVLNYGGYRNEKFEDEIDYLSTIFADGPEKAIRGKRIHSILNEDLASIYLYRNHSIYIYNKTIINPDIDNMVNSEYFFLTPEKWRMISQ